MIIVANAHRTQAGAAIAPRGVHDFVDTDRRGGSTLARCWSWYVAAVRRPLPREDDDGGDVW